MSDFLAFERTSNPLLLALESPELAHELDAAIDAGATLLVPQGVSIGDATTPFEQLPTLLRTHSLVFNPHDRTQFVTLGGFLGLLEGEIATTGSIFVFGTVPASSAQLSDPVSVFIKEQTRFTAALQTPERSRRIVVVLREGKLDLSRGRAISFLLISEPLVAPIPTKPAIVGPVVRAPPRRNTFFAKLRQPEAANVVRDLNSFARKLGGRLPRRAQEQAAELHGFVDKLTDVLVSNHPLWRSCSLEEADDIIDGTEKYLTAKLFPAIFPLQEEVALDERFAMRVRELWFVSREHLGVPTHVAEEQMSLAATELQSLNSYKSPQDKATIVLNCCKILSGACNVPSTSSEKRAIGADELLPMLIYVVLKTANGVAANTLHLASNTEFISHFRNPRRIAMEAKYCVTLLRSAISFIVDMTAESLCCIAPEEFAALSKGRPASQPQLHATTTASTSVGLAVSLPVDIATRSRRASDASSISPLSPGALVFDDLLFSPSPDVSAPVSRSETPKHRFVDTRPEDLKLGDVPALLAEYKELVQRVAFLERGGATSTQPVIRQQSSALSPTATDLLLR